MTRSDEEFKAMILAARAAPKRPIQVTGTEIEYAYCDEPAPPRRYLRGSRVLHDPAIKPLGARFTCDHCHEDEWYEDVAGCPSCGCEEEYT